MNGCCQAMDAGPRKEHGVARRWEYFQQEEDNNRRCMTRAAVPLDGDGLELSEDYGLVRRTRPRPVSSEYSVREMRTSPRVMLRRWALASGERTFMRDWR